MQRNLVTRTLLLLAAALGLANGQTNPIEQRMYDNLIDYTRARLAQENRDEYETKSDETFTYIDAFLQGFRSNEVIPSAMNCSKNLRESLIVYNDTKIQWANESNPDYGNTREQVFDRTEWISYNLAPASRYCFMTGLDVVSFVRLKDEQFGGFSEILPAWLQNLLGNVITLNSIQKKIDDAKLANDTVALCYWYGRLFNILLVFDPIEVDDFEDGYDEGADWSLLIQKFMLG